MQRKRDWSVGLGYARLQDRRHFFDSPKLLVIQETQRNMPMRPLTDLLTPREGNLRPAGRKLTDETINRCPLSHQPIGNRLGRATCGRRAAS